MCEGRVECARVCYKNSLDTSRDEALLDDTANVLFHTMRRMTEPFMDMRKQLVAGLRSFFAHHALFSCALVCYKLLCN